VEETDFEISHFRNLRTSETLTLDRVTWHTIVNHSLTSIYTPDFVKTENFVDGRRTLRRWLDKFGLEEST